jgi:hypothetical protein
VRDAGVARDSLLDRAPRHNAARRWQEGSKWNIKNLLRVNGALIVLCFLTYSRDFWIEFTKPKPKVDLAIAARERTQKAAKAALSKPK